jgi:hypothetical protein
VHKTVRARLQIIWLDELEARRIDIEQSLAAAPTTPVRLTLTWPEKRSLALRERGRPPNGGAIPVFLRTLWRVCGESRKSRD